MDLFVDNKPTTIATNNIAAFDPLATTTAHETTAKQDEPQQGVGVFAELFRGGRDKKQRPTISNGAADLLDADQDNDGADDGETTTHDESSAGSSSDAAAAAVVTDEEENEAADEESEGDVDEGEEEERTYEYHSWQDQQDEKQDEFDGDEEEEGTYESLSRQDQQDEKEDEFETFGGFKKPHEEQDQFVALEFTQAPKYEDNDEDDAEMTSLIGGTRSSGVDKFNNRLGVSFSKLFGIKPFKEEEQKERQSLLCDDKKTDEEDGFEDSNGNDENGSPSQNRSLLLNRSPRDDYFDAQEDSSDEDKSDLASEPGEYRLECFYPSSSCRQEFPDEAAHANREDLYGRIHGFGSESSCNFHHDSAITDSSTSSKFFINAMSDQRMSSMNIQSAGEKRSLLGGVGKAVQNITQLLMQKRADFQSGSDDERKRLVSYIRSLEHKLKQRERELQMWKERAEQLQLEMHWLKENEDGTGKDTEVAEEDKEDGSEEATEVEGDQVEERALIVFEVGADGVDVTEEVQEGTLIDMTPQRTVFDPLEGERETYEEDVKDDLMDPAHFQPTGEGSRASQQSKNSAEADPLALLEKQAMQERSEVQAEEMDAGLAAGIVTC